MVLVQNQKKTHNVFRKRWQTWHKCLYRSHSAGSWSICLLMLYHYAHFALSLIIDVITLLLPIHYDFLKSLIGDSSGTDIYISLNYNFDLLIRCFGTSNINTWCHWDYIHLSLFLFNPYNTVFGHRIRLISNTFA